MKRLALRLLLLTAVASICLLSARPGAEARPDATITVNSTGDSNERDGVLTLREAMFLATGGLAVGDLDSGECGQVSNSTYGPPCSTTDSIGAASADTIDFDTTVFEPGSPATIDLGDNLPALSTGNDTVDGSLAGVIVRQYWHPQGQICFDVTSDGNAIKGLQIWGCDPAAVYIHSGAQNNTVGGTTASERNVIFQCSNGVVISDTGTSGNMVRGNYIGTDATGNNHLSNGNGVVIWNGAQNNTIGGSTAGERNVISANNGYGVEILDTNTTGNTVKGNYIGTNAAGTAALSNFNGVYIRAGSSNNVIGGSTAGERNVISGNTSYGVVLSEGLTNGNTVKGNYIGTDATGTVALPNDTGVAISGSAQNNTVGGSTQGERNVISGNSTYGLQISGPFTSGNAVKGNYIGTDVTGSVALPNGYGVYILGASAENNIIGGTTAADRNVISGNTYSGVYIQDGTHNTVKANYIGTDASGTVALPNDYGVVIQGPPWDSSAYDNTVGGRAAGEGNVIAYNRNHGVYVSYGASNTINGNSIHSNGGKGIETDYGGMWELSPPIIDSVGSASGHTEPICYPCTVEVFSDDEDEGRIYHGYTATNADGTWAYPGPVTGPNITATITDASGNTSEFSNPVPLGGPTPTPPPPITPTPTPTPTPPPEDQDGDGLPDYRDGCPLLAEDFDGFQDADGCPDADNDMDGICDPWATPSLPACIGSDACPNVLEDYDAFQDTDGCLDPDNDGDFFPDFTDQCPGTDASTGDDGIPCTDDPNEVNTCEDYDGIIDWDGCHDSPGDDHDADGFTDEVETYVGTDPTDGCTDAPGDLDAWPFDINIDTWSNVLDVLLFKGHLQTPVGDPNYDQRLDLNADEWVNVLDVLRYKGHLQVQCTNP